MLGVLFGEQSVLQGELIGIALLHLARIQTVKRAAALVGSQNGKVHDTRKNIILRSMVVVLALLLVLSSGLAVFENNNASSLQSQLSERDSIIDKRGKVVTWLDKALNLTQLTLNLKPPLSSQYLTTLPNADHGGNLTKIFLVSSVVGYSYDPYPWPLNTTLRDALEVAVENGSVRLPDFGWQFMPGNYEYGIRLEDNPVLIVGVTVRNDYASADAGNGSDVPIGRNPFINRYSSWIDLTVKFYSQNGSVIQALKTTESHKFSLGSGETAKIVFYFSPPSQDVDHYIIYVSYLSANW